MTKHSTPNPTLDSEANLGRRNFLKASTAAVVAPMLLTSRKGGAQVIDPVIPPSPPTTPWREELPNEIAPLQSVNLLSPDPSRAANTASGECGRADHQRWAEFFGGQAPVSDRADLYELRARE